jgi:ABC-type transport system involved in multi-copper enzyme maturation permease subunit
MPLRWGPGPAFVHESIATTRRWQLYALRSLFVLGLLAGLGIGWLLLCMDVGKPVGSINLKELAKLGEYTYYAIATAQLLLVLIVAPAATAGAICQDRARGNLTHMLVTDLGDAEIVLGKLAARLAPILGLVAATIPVLALAGLLGGVIMGAILTLTLVSVALAVFGCTLALAISVTATKTHEVLMAVYGIEAAWALGPLVWWLLAATGVVSGTPPWFVGINSFVLAWAPYGSSARSLNLAWFAEVLGSVLAISGVLAVYALLRLRSVVTRGTSQRASRLSTRVHRVIARLSSWRRGPSLDKDPVLWRESRRGRPSRLAKIVWGVFIALSLVGTGWGIVVTADDYGYGDEFLLFVSGLEATFGLLLVSLAAPTALAEERARGSVDVLMTTPLSTDRIVLAKWWGAYRVVPALALLPALGALCIAATAPEFPLVMGRVWSTPAPLVWIDRMAYVCLPVGMLLTQGAAVVSVGLALATWSRRVGRAVAISVTAYAFAAFILPIFIEIMAEVLPQLGYLAADPASTGFFGMLILTACPLGGQCVTATNAFYTELPSRWAFYIGQVIVLLATLGFSLTVLAATMMTFNRCVGRVSERLHSAPRPPRRLGKCHSPRVRRSPAVAQPVLGAGI